MKLLDKMCKYEMDTASIAKDTILPTDGQTDKVKPVYPPSLSRGIISLLNTHLKEPCLPWTNPTQILPQGMSLPSLTAMRAELHPGEQKQD